MKHLQEVLLTAQISFLDDLGVSQSIQSVFAEMFFWMSLYLVYSVAFSTFLRAIFNKRRFWPKMASRSGVFCENAQDDFVLLSVLGTHHVFGGTLMACGVFLSDPTLWRHGFLVESGFEIADILALIFNLYPYKSEGVKQEIKGPTICHHLSGLSLSVLILESGLHENRHLCAVGMWLLLHGGIASFVASYTHTLDFDTQMTKAAGVQVFGTFLFLFARFVMFPREAMLLIQDVTSPQSPLAGGVIPKMLYGGAVFMTLFNIGIALDILPKTVRYVRRALDGTTKLDLKPIPPSKEQRMMAQKRRRSSVAIVLEKLDETVDKSTAVAAIRPKRFSKVLLPDPLQAALEEDEKRNLNAHGKND